MANLALSLIIYKRILFSIGFLYVASSNLISRVLIDYCICTVVESTPKEKSPHITPNKAQFIRLMIADHQEDYEVSKVWYTISYILLLCV